MYKRTPIQASRASRLSFGKQICHLSQPAENRGLSPFSRKASRLLETSHAGVAEVTKRVGYDAEAAFSKAFKRWIGVAPGAYRRTSDRRIDADRAPADLR